MSSIFRQLGSTQKLRIFHIFNHAAATLGLFYFSPIWLCLSLFVWFLIGSLGISICFHRLLSHKAFSTYPVLENTFSFLGCLATGGSPIAWVGAHRMHHLHTDTQNDPHSWYYVGKINTYIHFWKPIVISYSSVKDLLKKPFIVFLHRYYFLILIFWLIILYSIHPIAGVFVYSLPAVLAFHAFGLINLFGHTHGYRTYDTKDSSTNSWIANLLTWGEGWHNNHHRHPKLYRIGLARNEIDISAWVLEEFPIMRDSSALGLKKYEKN